MLAAFNLTTDRLHLSGSSDAWDKLLQVFLELWNIVDSEEQEVLVALGYTKGSMWSWFEEPSNEMRLRRFGIAMNGVNSMQPPDAILKGEINVYCMLPTVLTLVQGLTGALYRKKV